MFRCRDDGCVLRFAVRADLLFHYRDAHDLYPCNYRDCYKFYRCRESLKEHVRSVHEKKFWVCSHCGSKYKHHGSFYRHRAHCSGGRVSRPYLAAGVLEGRVSPVSGRSVQPGEDVGVPSTSRDSVGLEEGLDPLEFVSVEMGVSSVESDMAVVGERGLLGVADAVVQVGEDAGVARSVSGVGREDVGVQCDFPERGFMDRGTQVGKCVCAMG